MLKLHGTPKSRNFRCIWAAEEAGIPYEIVPVGLGAPVKSPAHLKVNPNGKIPAMEDGDLVLFESLAINLHIAGKAGAPLSPSGDDYSRVLQWTLWAATEVEPSAVQWAYNAYIRPREERDAGQAAAGAAGLAARQRVRRFVAGEAKSLHQHAGAIRVVARPEASLDIGAHRGEGGKVRLLRQVAQGRARLHEAGAGIRLDGAGGDLQQRRLAGTVAPDKAQPFSGGDRERRVFNEGTAAEGQADILEEKQRRSHWTGCSDGQVRWQGASRA